MFDETELFFVADELFVLYVMKLLWGCVDGSLWGGLCGGFVIELCIGKQGRR